MKAKAIFLISLIMLSFSSLFAQQISDSDVPQDVFISFKYKYPDAEIIKWESSNGNFVAEFKIIDQQGTAEFSANGKWLISRFYIAEKELPSPILTYFKNTYNSYEYGITQSDLVKDENGETYYYLQTKKTGINQPKAIELFFDLSGKFLRKIEPEENKLPENITNDTPPDSIIPATKLTQKELPTPINSYLRANYPDHSIKESVFKKDIEMGDVYYLILKQQGFKDQIELYFDITGLLLKKIDSREIKSSQIQTDKNVKDGQTQTTQTNKTPNPEEIKKKKDGDPIPDSKVPAIAKTHFASKIKKATNVEWFRAERNYAARYLLSGKKGQALYSEEGNWIESRNEIDPSSMVAIIQSYLKDNFRKLTISKAEYVQLATKSKYYEVQMVPKIVKEGNPDITKVTFDANGKYSSVEKPDVSDPNDKDKQAQKEADDAEFLEKIDASNQTIENGTGVNEVINTKELPTDVINYIKTNFKEHVIKESRYLFDDDVNAHIYYVTVKKEGDKFEIELYFDLSGKLIKKIEPTEQKFNNENANDKVLIDEVSDGGAETINSKELPSGIKNYLNKNYPDHKVDEATYKTDEEFGNVYFLVLKKQGDKTLTKLWFDLSGKLVHSEQIEDSK